MKKYPFYLSLLLSVLLLTSCEKVIDLDLNSKDPRIVIEGIITDEPGPYHVNITKSINFDQPNDFPAVNGAIVIITDDQAGSDTLTEISPGEYRTNTTIGVPGHTYSLFIRIPDGNTYSAVCKMPDLVPMDSVGIDSLEFFGTLSYSFTPYYNDPAVMGNRYLILMTTLAGGNEDFMFDDRINNGLTNTRPVFSEDELAPGDSVTITKQDLDPAIYDYFNTLNLVDDGNTPANPPSNISNNALGYFSAHTVQTKKLVIP